MRTTAVMVGCVVAVLSLVTACSDDDEPAPTPGLANPASEFCVQQGGTVDIVDGQGGQQGICVLPDGTRVDEWQYFYEQTGSTTT